MVRASSFPVMLTKKTSHPITGRPPVHCHDPQESVIFWQNLKIRLGVGGRPHTARAPSDLHGGPAVPASPGHRLVTPEDPVVFNVFQQDLKAPFLLCFGNRDGAENSGDHRKAFFRGKVGKLRVHLFLLMVLALNGRSQIFGGRTPAGERCDNLCIASFLKFEKPLCVLLLVSWQIPQGFPRSSHTPPCELQRQNR